MMDAPIVVDFLRHGATAAASTLLGRTDLPLTEIGRLEVARQVDGKTWPTIISSPLGRARETALIAAGRDSARVEFDEDWQEMDFGDWEGRSFDEFDGDESVAQFYENPDLFAPPNGESLADVQKRIRRALERIVVGGASPLLVVAHGGSIRVALAMLSRIHFKDFWAFRIACGTRITVEIRTHPEWGFWGEIMEIVQPPRIRRN